MYKTNTATEQLRGNFNVRNAALYVRLSKEDSDKTESNSVLSQKEILKEFLKLHPELEFYDFYVDDGYSGTNFERPAFRRLEADIVAGKIGCVVVKDLSRFARNYTDAGYYIEDFFVRYGVRFIAINNALDSASGNMNAVTQCITVGVTNVINESVAATTSVNVKGTLNVRRANGDFIGSFATYGYLKNPENKHKLIVDEEAADVVRMIFQKFVSGVTILGITRELNALGIPNPSSYKKQKGFNYKHPLGKTHETLWPESSVRRILKNEMYIGNMVQGKNKKLSYKIKQCVAVPREEWYVVEGTHEAIIDKETFGKAQALFNRNIRESPDEKRAELFAGIVRCADCLSGMAKKSNKQNGKEYHYYRCSTARISTKSCSLHTIRIDKLEQAVLVFVQKMVDIATEYDEIIKAINSCPKRINQTDFLAKSFEKLVKEREFTNGMICELYPDFKKGIITAEEFTALKKDCNEKLAKIDKEIEMTREKIKEHENGMKSNSFIENFKKLGNIDKLTRPLVLELIEEILIHEGGKITIRFKCKDAFEQAREYIELNKNAVKTA